MGKDHDRKHKLASDLVYSLTPTQRQALGALFINGGDDGVSVLEDSLVGALHADACLLNLQLSEVTDCTKCNGTGSIKRKEQDIKCSHCKGLGKFDEALPNFAFSLAGEQTFVSDIYTGQENPWEKYPYLVEELSSAMEAERVEEDDEIE